MSNATISPLSTFSLFTLDALQRGQIDGIERGTANVLQSFGYVTYLPHLGSWRVERKGHDYLAAHPLPVSREAMAELFA